MTTVSKTITLFMLQGMIIPVGYLACLKASLITGSVVILVGTVAVMLMAWLEE